MSKAMLSEGECGYCHTALKKPSSEAPKVVHVTKVELRGPDVHVGGLFDSVTARIAGCFSGCLSMGITLGVTGMIFAFVAWQLWVQAQSMPQPQPSPHPAPSGDHPRKKR